MKTRFTLAICLLATLSLRSQSNIQQSLSVNGTGAAADASAQFDVSATDKGMLVPRMTTAQRTAIPSPATGLLVFEISLPGTPGSFWYFNGLSWVNLGSGGGSPTSFIADADNNTKVQTEKSPNENIIRFDLDGAEIMVLRNNASGSPRLELPHILNNTFVGFNAGAANTYGHSNTAIGNEALRSNTSGQANTACGELALHDNTSGIGNTASGQNALYSNTTGSNNTATGWTALLHNTTGGDNTAIGKSTLYSNTTGISNTATGNEALRANTTGDFNTATGNEALRYNTTGDYNTANGSGALRANTTGTSNTACGQSSLLFNTVGSFNTAHGNQALNSNTTGNNNTANGLAAMASNTSGIDNTAIGSETLLNNTSGSFSTAIGRRALFNSNGSSNTAIGNNALLNNTTGFANTAIGIMAGATGTSNTLCVAIGADSDVGFAANSYSNAIVVGYDCNSSLNNFVRIGNTSITNIGGQVGWSNYSDGRFKRNVQENVVGLDFITRLRPVTYQWDIHKMNDFLPNSDTLEWEHKYDIEQIRFTGFVAQEVEAAASSIGFDFSGVVKPQNEYTPYSLRYAEFVVPLVKAVQEQQSLLRDLGVEIGNLKLEIAKLKHVETENAALKSQLDNITAALQGAGIAMEK